MPLQCKACGTCLRHGDLLVAGNTHEHGLECVSCNTYFALEDESTELVLHRHSGTRVPWYYARKGCPGAPHGKPGGAGMTAEHLEAQNRLMDAVNDGKPVFVLEAACSTQAHWPAPRRLQFAEGARAALERRIGNSCVTDVLVFDRASAALFAFEVYATHWTSTPRPVDWVEVDACSAIAAAAADSVLLQCIRHANPHPACRRAACAACVAAAEARMVQAQASASQRKERELRESQARLEQERQQRERRAAEERQQRERRAAEERQQLERRAAEERLQAELAAAARKVREERERTVLEAARRAREHRELAAQQAAQRACEQRQKEEEEAAQYRDAVLKAEARSQALQREASAKTAQIILGKNHYKLEMLREVGGRSRRELVCIASAVGVHGAKTMSKEKLLQRLLWHKARLENTVVLT